MLSFASASLAEEDMAVTCSKCGGGRFELGSVSSSEPARQFTILHCAACGQSLGLPEIDAVRSALHEQQTTLNDLRHQLNEIRDRLEKLATG